MRRCKKRDDDVKVVKDARLDETGVMKLSRDEVEPRQAAARPEATRAMTLTPSLKPRDETRRAQ